MSTLHRIAFHVKWNKIRPPVWKEKLPRTWAKSFTRFKHHIYHSGLPRGSATLNPDSPQNIYFCLSGSFLLIHFGYGSTTFLYHHKRSGTETDSISCNLPSRSVRGRFAPRNLAKTTVFMHEQQPYPIWFCPCAKAILFSIVKIVTINGLWFLTVIIAQVNVFVPITIQSFFSI